MASFMNANAYGMGGGSTYSSKRNTMDTRDITMPEPDYGAIPHQLFDDEDVRAAAMRVAQLSKTHEYVLPPAVRDAQHAWTVWSQGIAVTAALFAAVEAQLFSLIGDASDQDPLTQAFRIFSYLGLLSNLLATTSALFVLERVSGLSTRARRLSRVPNSLPYLVASGQPLPPDLLRPLKETALLRAFGMDATWAYTIGTFYLFSVLGCVSIFIQLTLYLFIRESVGVACTLTSLVVLGLLPLGVLALRVAYEFVFD
ncbi:hypothetical protein BDV93DRAFT_523753 [Ceratobasidium sp. AG-I]|nr:hypothetical protein BDV93DRAFT_523753 [Ceratobasidium sp. AG-I]